MGRDVPAIGAWADLGLIFRPNPAQPAARRPTGPNCPSYWRAIRPTRDQPHTAAGLLARGSAFARLQVGLHESRRRAGEPGLDYHLVEVVRLDPVETHEHGRVAVEVRCGEE